MAESIQGIKRTRWAGELRAADCNQEVIINGWVQRVRRLGGLIFITVRDRTGLVQCNFNQEVNAELYEKADSLRSEYVVAIRGTVAARGADAVNPNMPTGEIELIVSELRILGKAETTPFEISDEKEVGDTVRLKYRYLDLRRPSLTKNILMRHQIAKVTRDYFYENGFIEIETPMMMKSTPEGARDYIVPSRVHPGSFYALPQSPQIYKQLLMLSGYDRYIQLARCFRDEDLRADRQPEFTQIDLEMSFVDVEDILQMIEGFIKRLWKEVLDKDIENPLPRLTYADAMNRYGSDKPDTRFGMEIQDVSNLVKDSRFGVFANAVANGGSVRAIVAKNAASTYTRKEIDKLTEHARGIGASGLAFVRWVDETPNCSFAKFFEPEELQALLAAIGCERGDVALFVADRNSVVLSTLGALRLIVAKRLDIIPDTFNFLWITEFPFFEKNEETGSWDAMHHPFTMPLDECIPYLESDPGSVRAKAYDLVLNGTELLSGSIRINDPELQQKMFQLLGLTKEEIDAKFGFLVDAYRYGAPPHGGAGLGLDRITMLMCGCDSLRDVIAFPKVQNASELMSVCPSTVDEKQLQELHIKVDLPEKE
ncbi:MAG: aspartate--tRNA ligase [Ruminococcaceae bacterium]|nr:aspartate--tRNA ligase [Oscillospiraceae bacterium]